MPDVIITGWREGLRKISVSRLLREHCGLGLRDSKTCVDRVLGGKSVRVTVADRETSETLIGRLAEAGAVAEAVSAAVLYNDDVSR
jgi:ribosomal protein L7/L12